MNALQRSLMVGAEQYLRQGYEIGVSEGKGLVDTYSTGYKFSSGEDGISIILDGLVCVDFDTPDLDVGWYVLPPTLKERSPRGWHLFYQAPPKVKLSCKIKWKSNIDLLVKETNRKKTVYDSKVSPFGSHVLCSPTIGYTRIYPDQLPHKNSLTMAPDWLIEQLKV